MSLCAEFFFAASRSRERDRVPFPREDAPALPSNSTAVPSASASSGSRDGTVGRPSSIGVGRSISASTPSNSHIPLAMRNRHRENSDPHAKLLATAAARAPGSPPQHTIALAQQHNSQQQQRQRTPERGGLERQGSLRTPELALDMKRLLAKPVSVSAARLPSDSEDVFAAEGRRPSLDGVPIRRKHYDSSGRREEGAVVAARRSEDSAKDRARQKAEREVALALVGPHGAAQEKEKEKRPKNVLRRRPSAQRPQTAPTEPPTLSSPAVLMPPAARTAPPVLSLNLSLNPMQLPSFDSSGASPKGSPPEDGNDGNGQLTPAGAVVEAYKRGLETSPSGSPLPSPASPSHMFNRTPASDNGHDPPKVVTPPVTPYYTVFGSTSGRVVAVGGPEDSWDGAGSYISATAFPMLDGIRRTAKNSVGRTLTRKVSERWTKKREDSEEEVRGRTSSQTDPRKKSTRSASRAGAEETPVEAEFPKSPVTMTQEDVGGFTNEPRSRRSEPAMGGGSRIWKLMKRISTGGLKEKYERGTPRTLPPLPPMPPVAIPPVPQLPKEHALEVRTAMSSDGHSQEPGVLTRFMQSRTSISTSRPTAPGSTIPRPSARALPMPPPIPASQSQPRTSTATRSSSPVSSDVASSKYFHKTTGSARSSTSSYGEETAPPLPKVIIGKHIIPPKELYKLELEGDFKPSSLDDKVKPMTTVFRSTEDWRIIATPAEEHPPPLSLPHPPRRLPTPNANAKERRVSDAPSIPEFSTAAPINAFTPRKTQPVMDRPRVESLLSSLGPAPAAPRRSISSVNEASGVQDDTFGRQNWRTSSAPSTSSRPQRSQQRATSVPRVPQEPLTFRELTKQSMQLSEKEKADKWEDLLERSNRAGGTIHLGTSDKLASDDVSLRYSASSAQLLKDF
ncbi:hypothetical protein C8F01DRAFT_1080263 [Mycena amicta]|nr:hypothetical protein C8F01DRAFT_1080263 [Mycena amicta]